MKKVKRMRKSILAAVVCLAMLAQTFIMSAVGVSAATQTIATFEDSFDYSDFSGGAWVTEHNIQNAQGGLEGRNSLPPEIKNGVMKFDKGEGIRLDWQKLSGFETFDVTKTYTLTFDVKVTDKGNGSYLENNPDWTREVFFALAGWYNQIEFRNAPVSAGAKYGIRVANLNGGEGGENWTYSDYNMESTYSCKVVWQPSVNGGQITSTVTDGTNTMSGTRKGNVYSDINIYTSAFVWRCEDGKMELDNISFSDGTHEYSEDFDEDKSYMTATGIWELETKQRTDAQEPDLGNGVLELTEKSSVNFNWTKVPSVGNFDANNTYTFEFDVTVTNSGDGTKWGTANDHTRALYVGFGGWHTMLSMPDMNNKIDIAFGGQKIQYDHEGDKLHVKLTWKGNDVDVEVSDDSGVLGSGRRTSNSYSDMGTVNVGGVTDAPMTYLTLRCEDGAAQIDNFKFSAAKITLSALETTAIDIEEGKQAIYECDVNYKTGTSTEIKFGNATLFSVTPSKLVVSDRVVTGAYTTGIYHIMAYINPEQKMLTVEVTMPDGGAIRRGMFNLLGGSSIVVSSTDTTVLSNVKVEYTDINVNDYTITQNEPVVETDIFNVVTSFNEASTTRNFAWTVKGSFLGSTMAVRYRVAGTSSWTSVDAVKKIESKGDISGEDYFECDISGLTASTTYEYQIGKKDGASASDWSKTYTFKTAAESITDFSFIAIGDTQGHNWGGDDYDDTKSNKGAKYSKLAYDVALSEMSDPSFIMHTGDVVEDGDKVDLWNLFFKAFSDYGTSIPLFATMGNHDSWIEDKNFLFDLHFNHPNTGPSADTTPLDPTDINNIPNSTTNNTTGIQHVAANIGETTYSFNYGDVHFISLNSGGMEPGPDACLVEAQREWLIADLEANKDARWTIIFQHQPVYHRRGGSEDRSMLNDVIEGYGVDLVIQGHSHLNTRTYPMVNGGEIATKEYTDLIPEGTGTIYTTIGSAALNHDGVSSETLVECMYNVVVPDYYQPTYTTVDVDGDRIVVTTKQVNGLIIDRFVIGEPLSEDDDINGSGGNNDDINGGGENNEDISGGNTNNGNTGNDNTNSENTNNSNSGNTNTDSANKETSAPKETESGTASTETESTIDASQKKASGCGASIASASVLLVTALGTALPVLRKKEE